MVDEREWWSVSHRAGWVCKRTRLFCFSCNLMDSLFTSILVHAFKRRTGNSAQIVWSWKFKKNIFFIRGLDGGGSLFPAFQTAAHYRCVSVSEKSYLRRNKKVECYFNWICFPFLSRLSGENLTHLLIVFNLKSIILIMRPFTKKTTTQACVYNYFSHWLYQWTTKTSRRKEKRVFWKWLLNQFIKWFPSVIFLTVIHSGKKMQGRAAN